MILGKSFGSDNHSGVHPEVMQALIAVNDRHQPAYGADRYTQDVQKLFCEVFDVDTQVFFVFTGTAANTLAIRCACHSYEAVVTSDIAHLNEDECGAPEFISGNKILSFPAENGKLPLAVIKDLKRQTHDPHRVMPRLVSITQATEVGTVYNLEEISAITAAAHSRGLIVHMDGARLANAAVFLACELADISCRVGVDILSFGGTKNGLLGAEAVVIFKPEIANNFAFHRKQSMQLASKMRFLACQFQAYLTGDLWRRNADNANTMAQYLRQRLATLEGSSFPYPTEANEVFVSLPQDLMQSMQKQASAYIWDAPSNLLRFVTSFDTQAEDIDRLFAQV